MANHGCCMRMAKNSLSALAYRIRRADRVKEDDRQWRNVDLMHAQGLRGEGTCEAALRQGPGHNGQFTDRTKSCNSC